MKSIKNILVALDLTELDEELIQYAAYICKTYHAEKVYFVHNIKRFEISKFFQKELDSINLDEVIEKKIEKNIAQFFATTIEHEVLISDDPYTESLITYVTNKYDIDLLMVGNKNTYKGTGAVSGKLLRMVKCDVLSVPKTAKIPSEKTLCITDFSLKSQKGIKTALDFTEKSQSHLSCLSVNKIPAQFFPVINLKEVRLKIEKHTAKSFEKLFQTLKIDQVSPVTTFAGDNSIPEKIREVAEHDFDILFTADKGQSNFSSLLIGSTTEELFTHYLTIPLWVAK